MRPDPAWQMYAALSVLFIIAAIPVGLLLHAKTGAGMAALGAVWAMLACLAGAQQP